MIENDKFLKGHLFFIKKNKHSPKSWKNCYFSNICWLKYYYIHLFCLSCRKREGMYLKEYKTNK